MAFSVLDELLTSRFAHKGHWAPALARLRSLQRRIELGAYAASVHDIVHKHGGKYLSRSGT